MKINLNIIYFLKHFYDLVGSNNLKLKGTYKACDKSNNDCIDRKLC